MAFGSLLRFDGAFFHRAATRNFPPPLSERNQPIPPFPGSALRHLTEGRPYAMVDDIVADQVTRAGDPGRLALAMAGARTAIWVALRKDEALLERWAQLSAVRDEVNLQLEEKRKDKTIAANLSAKVRLGGDGDRAAVLRQYADFLPTLFGVSEVDLTPGAGISVERAGGTKCERCWRYVPAVSAEPDRTGLCPRCVEALAEPVSL